MMNTKKLGKKQIEILRSMKRSGYVLRMIHDYRRDQKSECWLEDDEGANTYERVSCDFAQNLYDRGLTESEEFNPCLGIDIITFRVTRQLKTLCL